MTQEQKTRIELPEKWRKVNFYSLNLAYCFFVLFVSLQVQSVSKILIKAFGEGFYDALNGWVLIGLLITAAGAGILGFIRMISVKKLINLIENEDDKRNG